MDVLSTRIFAKYIRILMSTDYLYSVTTDGNVVPDGNYYVYKWYTH